MKTVSQTARGKEKKAVTCRSRVMRRCLVGVVVCVVDWFVCCLLLSLWFYDVMDKVSKYEYGSVK